MLNNSALATYVMRSSQSDAMFRIVMAAINAMGAVFPFGAWYDRVPSKSNAADYPSREEADDLCDMFAAVNHGTFTLPEDLLQFIMDPCFSAALLEDLMQVVCSA